jgi:hypothetical protein
MPRITVKVEVPNTPDDLMTLIGKIVAQDAALNTATPGSSPVNPKDITALKAIQTAVQPNLDLAKKLKPQLDAATQSSDTALGLADGQTVRTDGTGLFLVTKVRDGLAAAYKGQEKQMEGFGYSVVIGSAASPQRKTASQTKSA